MEFLAGYFVIGSILMWATTAALSAEKGHLVKCVLASSFMLAGAIGLLNAVLERHS